MAAWLPVTASFLVVTGMTSAWALSGADCSECTAPASSPAPVVAPAEVADIEAGPTLEKQDVFVLKFHADWCGKCKSLNPVYDAMVKEFGEQPVAFVKLDVTNKDTQEQTEKKMKGLGLDELWASNKNRNGFIMVVDAETKKSVAVLKRGTTNKQASDAIKSALDS